MLALAILWILKSTDASLIFPLMVLALVLFRKVMDYFPKVFSQRDLFWLDNLMPQSDKKDDESEEEDEKVKKIVKSFNGKMIKFIYRHRRSEDSLTFLDFGKLKMKSKPIIRIMLLC